MSSQATLLPAFFEAPPEDYVVADHPFTSDPSRSQANVYLSFQAGDKIRIYNRDPASGWWDGELVVTGGKQVAEHARKRGWLPSNHVSPIDPTEVFASPANPDHIALRRPSASSISSAGSDRGSSRYRADQSEHRLSSSGQSASTGRSAAMRRESDESGSSASMAYEDEQGDLDEGVDLEQRVERTLEPVTQAIALVHAAILAKRQAHFQPSTACVISSIRSLLAASACLSRDSILLKEYPALAKIRKTILANLAELVALARSASSPFIEGDNADDDEMKEMEMEGMLKAGQDTLENVRVFLTTMGGYGIPLPERKDGEFPSIDGRHRATESSSTIATRHTYGSSADSTSSRVRVEAALPRRERKSSAGSDRSKDAPLGLRPSALHAPGSQHRSTNVHRGEEGNAPMVQISRPPAAQQHRSSFRDDDGRTSSSDLGLSPLTAPDRLDVLEVVAVIQDQLLSAIAALIGHTHTHSTSSHPSVHAYLIDITRETIDRIRELLVIVEAVEQHRQIRAIWPRESAQLLQSKADMYDVTSRLIEAAKKAASVALHTVTDGEDDSKVNLLQAATAVHRQAAVCIRLVQHCATRRGHPSRSFQIELRPDPEGSPELHDMSGEAARHFLRPQAVGQRGAHTLSSLGRQVIDLSSLQERIVRDGTGTDPSESDMSDSQEERGKAKRRLDWYDEEHTLQASSLVAAVRSPLLSSYEIGVHSDPRFLSPGMPSSEGSPASPGHRSRAASFCSPAATPRLLQHRSPSRSADLNMIGGDLAFLKTPRQDDKGFSKHRSVDADMMMSTPRPSQTANDDGRGERFADADHEVSHQLHNFKLSSEKKQPTLQVTTSLTAPRSDVRADSAPLPDTSTPMVSYYNAADMRMWLESHDYSPRDVTYNADGQVTGASLDVLVEKLTPHDTVVDADVIQTFFSTFRLFTTPARFLQTLELRYDLSPPARMPLTPETIRIWDERKVMPVRLRIYSLLKTWLEAYWNEESDGDTLDDMSLFIKERLGRALPSESPRLLALIASYKAGDTPRLSNRAFSRIRSSDRFQTGSPTSPLYAAGFFNATATTGLPPTPTMSKQLFNNLRSGSAGIVVTDFQPVELARQLTLMESKLYCAITADDLLQTGRKKIPSLRAMSTLSNRITGWVADSILDEQDTKRRTSLLKFFIKLTNQCLELNNFSTLFALLAGLNSSTIMRLRRTWDGLSNKYRVMIEDLRRVIEHTRNHANYRNRLRGIQGPALPFLGLILTDITFTSDGNPSHRPSALDPEVKLINFDKYVKLARIVNEFKRYQAPFNLAVLPDVQNYLERLLAERGSTSLDDLHRKSLFLEPRQGSEAVAASLDKPSWLTGRL